MKQQPLHHYLSMKELEKRLPFIKRLDGAFLLRQTCKAKP